MNQMTKAGDRIRSVVDFILFNNGSFILKENSLMTFAQTVRDCFRDFIDRKNSWIVTNVFIELPEKPDSECFVFWKTDRIRFAAAVFIHAIIPFYRFRNGKDDKHGKLILELLDSLVDGKIFNISHIQECDLEYYWHNETAAYLAKVQELVNMTDEKFKNLHDFDKWINSEEV